MFNVKSAFMQALGQDRMTKDSGSALDAPEKGTLPVRNPWSGDIAFTVSPAGAVELDRVVQAAKAAFRQFVKTPAHQRASWLNGAASAMEQASKSIIEATIAHIGKPRRAAEMEVKRSIAFVRACAQHLHGQGGEVVPLDMVPAGTGFHSHQDAEVRINPQALEAMPVPAPAPMEQLQPVGSAEEE